MLTTRRMGALKSTAGTEFDVRLFADEMRAWRMDMPIYCVYTSSIRATLKRIRAISGAVIVTSKGF
jgi:hypothetical protein